MTEQEHIAKKVLVVDDEAGYCRKIGRYLSAHGYDVSTASSAEEAVSIGSRLRPELVVTDWMLRGEVHGLHVIDALKAAYPEIRAVMMTGFASADLREEASLRDVAAFVEKPFSPEQLGSAVEHALRVSIPASDKPAVSLLVTDADRHVLHANGAATRLLGRPIDARTWFDALFAADATPDLEAAGHRWIETAVATSKGSVPCRLRARAFGGGHVIVICRQEEATAFAYDPSVKRLVGDTDSEPIRWNLAGHGLVVDPNGAARSLVSCVFEEMGSICHAADSFERALEIYKKDPEIRYVIIDCAAGRDIADFVAAVRSHRSDCTIVGQCEDQRDVFFSHAGIDNTIRKPWSVSDFVGLLISHG